MSHHSSERNPAMDEAFKKLFGEFPNGRLNPQDEGALPVQIGHEGNVVKMMFPRPTTWIGFTPDQAMEIAETLMKHARAIGLTKPFTLKV